MRAAAVVVAIALGVVGAVTQHRLTQAQAQAHSVAAVLAAPDARLTARTTTVGGTVTVVAAQLNTAQLTPPD